MTDNDIVKALEACKSGCCISKNCPYYDAQEDDIVVCTSRLTNDALDLINRQKVEIESLKIANEKLYDANKLQEAEIEEQASLILSLSSIKTTVINDAKAEAVKEFAERLKKKETTAISCRRFEGVISTDDIDNLVKEFTEGESHGMA